MYQGGRKVSFHLLFKTPRGNVSVRLTHGPVPQSVLTLLAGSYSSYTMSVKIWSLSVSSRINSSSDPTAMTPALATAKHKRTAQHSNRPHGPGSLPRAYHHHRSLGLDPLCSLCTSIPLLLISNRNSTQTERSQFCGGSLQAKVLLVEVRLYCCLESISRRLISTLYMQDLGLWLFLRLGYYSSRYRKLILFVDLAQSTHARVQPTPFSDCGDSQRYALTVSGAWRTRIRPE